MSTSDMESVYACSDQQYVQIQDSNLMNYSTGYVSFNSVTMANNDPGKCLDLGGGIFQLPYVATVNISIPAGRPSFGFTIAGGSIKQLDATSIMALAPKGIHHLIAQMHLRFSGRTIHQQTAGLNLFLNEQLKSMSADQYRMLGDLIGYAWDSADSYALSQTVLETNNSITPASASLAGGGLTAASFANTGHFQRIQKQRYIDPAINTTTQWAFGTPTGTVSSSIIAEVQACSVLGVYGTDAAGAFVQITSNANGVYQTADNAAASVPFASK
jgi:hypothetical protein